MKRQPTTLAIESIDVQIESHGQHSNYVEIFRCGGWRWRVTIHADTSYSEQSTAKIEVLDGFTWREIARLLPTQVTTKGVFSYAGRDQLAIPAGFHPDRDRLLKIALATLSMEA